jgi:hypothetical protein
MALNPTVLFDRPQKEIATLLVDRIARSLSTSIVTGFATPGGLSTISAPIRARPQSLKTLVVGAATYPAFQALDDLISAGVKPDRLRIHLGHTSPTGGRKNPFARYHPMLHSKVYYMELGDGGAAAFIGSHNVTTFALGGLNGEAAVLLEGPADSAEFEKVRRHVEEARQQAVQYSSGLKEAYAWWTREFVEGLRTEIGVPQDWATVRTIVVFASASKQERPRSGDQVYLEIPAGIEQIESLKTEVHLFLFGVLPADPWVALYGVTSADAQYTCKVLGVENRQGNREVTAHWHIDGPSRPVLRPVPSGTYRPNPPSGMQQVRAEVSAADVESFEYLFEREKRGWEPEFSQHGSVSLEESANTVALTEARGRRHITQWRLVAGLVPRGMAKERDDVALSRAAPDSGSFVLVSLRRRRAHQHPEEGLEF